MNLQTYGDPYLDEICDREFTMDKNVEAYANIINNPDLTYEFRNMSYKEQESWYESHKSEIEHALKKSHGKIADAPDSDPTWGDFNELLDELPKQTKG